MAKFCCKGCTERHVGCHSTCEKYITEKAENERLREKEHELKKQYQADSHTNGTYYGGRHH